MNRLNAKRIGVLAASLLLGLTVAGPVSFSNIPIINSAGQPVVQIVVGSQAMPSDGVVMANIAAVIGNLAYTSTPVTATVSGTSGVKCAVTTPSCTLTNQQVYLGESGVTAPSGTYGFTALIGSVLNGATILSAPVSTKSLTSSSSNAYGFPQTTAIQTSPSPSPFSTGNYVPNPTGGVSTSNGGGTIFSTFTSSNVDNILQVTHTQFPTLLSNYGPYGENEFLWITGFPVFDQQSSVNNFAVFDMGGAYQVTFNKPVPLTTSGSNTASNVQIKLLGQNWVIIGGTYPSGTQSSTTTVAGGTLTLAQSMINKTTVYVGHNLTSGPWVVQLTDLGQTVNNANPASVSIYYKGVLTNTSSIAPYANKTFNVTGNKLIVSVSQTFAGLYAYQKWAQLQLYSNMFPLNNGQKYNTSVNQGWTTRLLWTNATSSGPANALQSIIFYNNSFSNPIVPGGSLSYLTSPAAYKVTFVGDTLGSASYDPVTFTVSSPGNQNYKNALSQTIATATAYVASAPGTTSMWTSGGNLPASITQENVTSVTVPAQMLTVTSSIPNAFTVGAVQTGTVNYDLSPYQLSSANAVNTLASGGTANIVGTNIVVTGSPSNLISTTGSLTITVTGYKSVSGQTTPTQVTTVATVTNTKSGVPTVALTSNSIMDYVTNIGMSQAIPGLTITVNEVSAVNTQNQMTLATLSPVSTPLALYTQSGQTYLATASGSSILYNQQNGQSANSFLLTANSPTTSVSGISSRYFTMNVPEYNVPSQVSSVDQLSIGIWNNSVAGGSVLFQLNMSPMGNRNNVTYLTGTGGAGTISNVYAPVGFRTERGSKVASITPSSVTLNLATTVDSLQFIVGPANATTATTSKKTVGPYSVGQATNLANVTIANVTATCAFSTTSCTVSGLANVTATPSVTSAMTPVALNTATTPLAVLDTNANAASTLVVVGSKYVNSVAAQIFAQNPNLQNAFGPSSVVVQAFGSNRILVAGYYANQTVQAGNQFIQSLLSSAANGGH
jgi:hypothetical protein